MFKARGYELLKWMSECPKFSSFVFLIFKKRIPMKNTHRDLLKMVLLLPVLFVVPLIVHAQNVGIGTTSPSSKLTVNGNTDITGSLFINTVQKVFAERLTIRAGSDSFGMIHTNGTISLGTWIGNYGVKGGWLGTISKDNLLFFTNNGGAQAILDTNGNAGFGTINPDKSSQVDISSTTKGILIPRMSAGQRDGIIAPANGLLIFVNTDNSFYYRESSGWRKLAATGDNWSLAGNAALTGKFLGSTDTAAVRIRTSNVERITIDSAGNLGLGNITPNAALQFGNILNNRRLVLFQIINNDHQFFGFGTNSNILRYQVPASNTDHVFYAGASTITSNELMRIKGNGNIGIGIPNPSAKLDILGSVFQRGGPTQFNPSPDGSEGNMSIGAFAGNNNASKLYVTSILENTLYCTNPNLGGRAAFFGGRVEINGLLSKGGGSFKIDHPLDPENKYLYHSFVESPDMMNVYNGNIITDVNGEAVITMPDWFEALNRDFRYQLTTIGQFAQAMVANEINNNQFSIKTDKPGVKVSWMVTGIRHDAFANKNRIPVEEDKKGKEKGKYLQPGSFGKPVTLGIGN